MQNPKNIVLICGHPDKDTFTGQVTDRYHAAADEQGHNVHRFDLGELNFDPILHKGYKEIQPLEPDLIEFQEKIVWADHVVIVYPNWWCSMPALLKGLFDRAWLPGFAFNFNKETKQVEEHLKGKTGRVIILSGSHSPFKTWWRFGDYTNEIQYGIMEFAGIRTAVSAFGPCEHVDDKVRDKWMKEVDQMGVKGA